MPKKSAPSKKVASHAKSARTKSGPSKGTSKTRSVPSKSSNVDTKSGNGRVPSKAKSGTKRSPEHTADSKRTKRKLLVNQNGSAKVPRSSPKLVRSDAKELDVRHRERAKDSTYLSEVEGGGRITNPVPRTGPPEPTTEIERMLNIKWSKYIPKIPTAKQIAAMMLAHVKEVFYGGALGGGKSDWLAYEALRFCDLPGFSSIIFRRQLTDLKQPNSLIPRIAEWLAPHVQTGACRYIGDEHVWVFKTMYPHTDIPGPPARLQFGYIGEAAVRERYQSAEYQLVCFDELGQWPEDTDYVFMRSRLRKVVCHIHGKIGKLPNYVKGCKFCDTLSAMPTRIRAASNPGPAWIKRRFGIIPDPKQFKSRHEAMVAIAEGHKVRWVGTVPSRPFIPAYLEDNPHLDEAEYREMLREMSDEERSRLEDGNWEARKNARFKRRWQRFYQIYPEQRMYALVDFDKQGNTIVFDPRPFSSLLKVFTTTDPAVTVREGPVDVQVKQKNSSAVVSTWGETLSHDLLFMDCRKFKKEIPDLVDQLVEVNGIWQPLYNKIECNGVGIGLAQYAEHAGLRVVKNYRKNDKLENSLCAQMMMKHGRIYFPTNTEWGEEAEDDIFSWTGLPTEEDDIIDTMSDAATDIAPGIAQEMSSPDMIRSMPRAISTNTAHGGFQVPRYGLY